MSFLPHSELKRSKYRLLGLIGQGQFGQVFCAVHRPTGRLVALKNLEQERFPTHKFLRELRFLLSLQHPNIVTCQALEHTSTGRYLVMDYCEGGTLRSLMAEESFLSLPQSLKLVMDVLAGLDHAHSRGIVHCDIKPENILLHVQPEGWIARISDFGIARLLKEVIRQEGDTGSPAYMAPERFYGQYSAASDLYSVGILLFELITGYRPFSGTPAELMSAHLNAPLKLPDTIPAVWQAVIAQALQKLPARRFRSAGGMRSAIQAIVDKQLGMGEISESVPLFFTVVAPTQCAFQPVSQLPIQRPVQAVAVWPQVDHSVVSASSQASPINAWLCTATDRQVCMEIWPDAPCCPAFNETDETITQPGSDPVLASFDHLIDQLLVRPCGCFVVTPQSIGLLATAVETPGKETRDTKTPGLQRIHAWTESAAVTIDPQGKWFATIAPCAPESTCQLTIGLITKPQSPLRRYLPIKAHPHMQLLALDSRHLALILPPSPEEPAHGTTLHLLSRRGHVMGSFHLALSLQQVVLTRNPYQLLAVDPQPGNLLLIDLKPYRVKRLWVEIPLQFLATVPWGYVLGATNGQVVFLDQEGRSIGTLQCPEPLTAMTVVQPQGLILATWNGQAGNLYRFDLRTIGLDLVF